MPINKKNKKKISNLDKYVIFSIVALLIYTVINQILCVKFCQTMDTLTTCFYAAFGGEILSCCLIKIFKLKDKGDEKNNG